MNISNGKQTKIFGKLEANTIAKQFVSAYVAAKCFHLNIENCNIL